jgi:general stress protein YciG
MIGGTVVYQRYGAAWLRTIGQRGGRKTARRGREYMAALGQRGGEVTAERHGQGHYQEIGRKGARARWEDGSDE